MTSSVRKRFGKVLGLVNIAGRHSRRPGIEICEVGGIAASANDIARTSNPLVIDADDLAQVRGILTRGDFLFGWLVRIARRAYPELREQI